MAFWWPEGGQKNKSGKDVFAFLPFLNSLLQQQGAPDWSAVVEGSSNQRHPCLPDVLTGHVVASIAALFVASAPLN